jgi:hypothetical protein
MAFYIATRRGLDKATFAEAVSAIKQLGGCYHGKGKLWGIPCRERAAVKTLDLALE